jgi:hypothetical protein
MAKVGELRGTVVPTELDALVTVTIHPSAVLRTTGDDREAAFGGLREDLRTAASWL